MCLFNLSCTSLMALVQFILNRDYGAAAVFGTIAVLRLGQGLAVGLIYVIVQVK